MCESPIGTIEIANRYRAAWTPRPRKEASYRLSYGDRFNACSTEYGFFARLGVSYAELGFDPHFPRAPLKRIHSVLIFWVHRNVEAFRLGIARALRCSHHGA